MTDNLVGDLLQMVRIDYETYKFLRKNKTIPFHMRARLINEYRRYGRRRM